MEFKIVLLRNIFDTPALVPPYPWLGGNDPPKQLEQIQISQRRIKLLEDEGFNSNEFKAWAVHKFDENLKQFRLVKTLRRETKTFQLPSPGLYSVRAFSATNLMGEPLVFQVEE